jgi:hypothetical protein
MTKSARDYRTLSALLRLTRLRKPPYTVRYTNSCAVIAQREDKK